VLVPRLHGAGSITLAVGIVGATVMPHAIYLHSGLTQARLLFANAGERRRAVVMSNREVLLALGVAGLVNLAMIAMAAGAFHDGAHDNIAEIETAYRTLAPLLGLGAAGLFMLALLASGFSSSIVGVMAGQVSAPLSRVPSIIEAWFAASEKTICSAICPAAFREPRNRWNTRRSPDLAGNDQMPEESHPRTAWLLAGSITIGGLWSWAAGRLNASIVRPPQ
jgi:NRAMP (natural resistance-associated macrophage protein)-like metal ion transporter